MSEVSKAHELTHGGRASCRSAAIRKRISTCALGLIVFVSPVAVAQDRGPSLAPHNGLSGCSNHACGANLRALASLRAIVEFGGRAVGAIDVQSDDVVSNHYDVYESVSVKIAYLF